MSAINPPKEIELNSEGDMITLHDRRIHPDDPFVDRDYPAWIELPSTYTWRDSLRQGFQSLMDFFGHAVMVMTAISAFIMNVLFWAFLIAFFFGYVDFQ